MQYNEIVYCFELGGEGHLFSKNKDKKSNQASEGGNDSLITIGAVSQLPSNLKQVRQSTEVSLGLLERLKSEYDKFRAMDILVDETPHGKMALNIYSTLTNPDGEYKFYNPKTGKRTKRPEKAFETFAKRRWGNTDNGLEGLYELLIRSLYTRGDMAFEIVIAEDLSGIEAILVIDPATFQEYKWLPNQYRYAIYQKRNDGKKIDLYDGNFYRFPYQPNINNPQGTLLFLPAIQATIEYIQHKTDATVVLNRVGYPRYKMQIDDKAVLEMASYDEKQTQSQRNKLFQDVFNDARSRMQSIDRDSDFISFMSNQIEIIGGGVSTGLDLRSWFEMDAVDLANAYGLPKIYLNLEEAGSYAFGRAEQEVLIDRIDNSFDAIVDIKSIIGTIFCRLNGFNAICKFDPVPLEWQNLKEKWEAKNEELEFYRRLQEYGLLDPDIVANIMTGNDTAYAKKENFYEYVVRRISEEQSTGTSVTTEGDTGEGGEGDNGTENNQ